MNAIEKDLAGALSSLINDGKVHVTQTSRGVHVEINTSVLFSAGEARLNEQATQVIKSVGAVLKGIENDVQVEGFTDNTPISTNQFPSNWELSAGRACSVVRLLVVSGMKESQLIAIGNGANNPIESNDTPEGRFRNRRVQLIVLSSLPEVMKEFFMTNTKEKKDGMMRQ